MGDGSITIGVVVAYLGVLIAIGVATRGRITGVTDFLVASRRLGLWMTAATLAALQLGAGVILGGAEMAADLGFWPGTWFGIGAGGGLILAGLLVAGRLHGSRGFVPMDFFAERYGESRAFRLWAWISNIPSLLGILVIQLMACGGVLAGFGIERELGITLSAAVVLAYSALSGMWGAVATDFLQLALIVVAVPLLAFLASGSGSLQLADALTASFVPQGMGARAAYIILPFLLSISVSYDAFMRFQSARSGAVARRGAIAGGLIVLGISAAAAWIGASGRTMFPNAPAEEVFSLVMEALLSPTAAGLLLAAILAAAMSTANSLVMSLAGTFTRDFYGQVLHPGENLDELAGSTRLARGVVIAAVVVAALLATGKSGILSTMILFNVPYMASMLVPLLGGALWSGARPAGAAAAAAVGATGGTACFVIGLAGLENHTFPVDLGLMGSWVLSLLAFVIGSRIAPGLRWGREPS